MGAVTEFEPRKQYTVLAMNTLAFTVNFAVWTMFSVIGIKIKAELGLNETEFGLLVATPILTGSLVRLPLGLLTDRFGGRVVYFIQMILVAIATYGMAFAYQYWQYLAIGLCIGLAGGSFAIGIAYTSAWFQKERQGTVLGIFGAGNTGAALNIFAAPLIIVAMGWRAVPEIYSVAMLVMAVIFWFCTYPDPRLEERRKKGNFPSLGDMLLPLLEPRVWRYGLAYYFVFGGFVALSLWLPKYYMMAYGLELTMAAFISLFFVIPSGVIRALGGWFSDKWGGDTVTWWVFWASIICLFFLSYPPTTFTVHGIRGDVSFDVRIGVVLFTFLVFVVGIAQGIGKASVYRSLADHYPDNMGSVGGLVGVIGGLGGFTLPIMFGVAADATNIHSSTFMVMYAVLTGVMIWTWTAARGEREAILEQDPVLRDQMIKGKFLEVVSVGRRWLRGWRPDDDAFWRSTGRAIAMRNLILSMPPLLLSFTVWMAWSVVVVELPRIGFQFTTSELFWLAGAPGISGAALRLAYAFVVPVFGGRNWTVFSTVSLVIPTLWMALAVQDPSTDYAVFVVIALLCGLGGGNFSSSMANISFFFPKRMQGTALGWNAGVGKLGVALVQAVVPLAIFGGALAFKGGEAQTYMDHGVASEVWLQNAGYIWIPLILLATIAAALSMNNIRGVHATISEQAVIFRRKHAWLLALLCTGTFGSFIGFAAVFPILLSALFPEAGIARWAFIGPLLGALAHPFGGWLSDRLGGARVTLWNFAVMVGATMGALMFLPSGSGGNEIAWFFAAFILIFVTTGVGNGSLFHVVPTVFLTLHQRRAEGKSRTVRDAEICAGRIEASVALGFTAAIAALGLFFIPAMVALSMESTGTPRVAMILFIAFYVMCMFVTWWWYRRDGAEVRCD
ncbi:MAG: MFS transporter [Alphaproteobacteria bacterium]|jgi:NNP family nitrate/nitrite transporter-like MFS transporter|nr:MFS transporter [Alphaproteobacteria bacterium]